MYKRNLSYIALLVAFVITLLFFIVEDITSNHILSYSFVMLGIVGLWISGIKVEDHRNDYPWVIVIPDMIFRYGIWSLIILLLNIVAEGLFDIHIGFLWLTLAYLILLTIYAVRIISLSSGVEYIRKIDNQVKRKVSFVSRMVSEIDIIMNEFKTEEYRSELKRIREKLRYSDPISDDSLNDLEREIESSIRNLKTSLASKHKENIHDSIARIIRLVEERNTRCFTLK